MTPLHTPESFIHFKHGLLGGGNMIKKIQNGGQTLAGSQQSSQKAAVDE